MPHVQFEYISVGLCSEHAISYSIKTANIFVLSPVLFAKVVQTACSYVRTFVMESY